METFEFFYLMANIYDRVGAGASSAATIEPDFAGP